MADGLAAEDVSDAPEHPGAVAPERTRTFESLGVRLHLSEWGDPTAPPLVLSHGLFDNARGFDLLAPLLAERFRVIAIDARGHGESEWCDAYPWLSDVTDLVQVLRSLGHRAHLVGHSRGGGLTMDAAAAAPELVRKLVNIDGFGPPPEGFTIPGAPPDPRPLPERFADYLDSRRTAAVADGGSRPQRRLADLIERRRTQNPRLPAAWLRYFVFHSARREPRGWTWKADLRVARGFNPWRPDWLGPSWAQVRAPLLAVIGSEPDTWGPLPESVIGPRLAHVAQLSRATVAGAGHFVHMEEPKATAALLLDFLAP
jgi:pimeloyl-ACP methyl ester carboxylesterase